MWGVEDVVKSYRQFYDAQVRGQVSTFYRNFFDDLAPDLSGQLLHLRRGQGAQLRRAVNSIENPYQSFPPNTCVCVVILIIGALRQLGKHYDGNFDALGPLTPSHRPSEAGPTSFYGILTGDDFLLMMTTGKVVKGSLFRGISLNLCGCLKQTAERY